MHASRPKPPPTRPTVLRPPSPPADYVTIAKKGPEVVNGNYGN